MYKYIATLGVTIALTGCQSFAQLTPSQYAQLNCVVSNGVVQAVMSSPTSAAKTAARYQGAQVVLCNTGTQVGTILTK